jgi:hypothetical protein
MERVNTILSVITRRDRVIHAFLALPILRLLASSLRLFTVHCSLLTSSLLLPPSSPLAASRLPLAPSFRSLLTSSFLFFLLLVLAGCSGKTLWYKDGSGQAEFDRDAVECRILADELGRQDTLTGKRPALETRAKAYQQCLFAKGWSHIPPGQSAGDGLEYQPLATVEHGTVKAFGTVLVLPDGFAMTAETDSVHGPMLMQTLSFRGPDNVFLNLVFQQSRTLSFEPIPYPVDEPFLLYERGVTENGAQWAAFWGRVQGAWVAGLGAYRLHSRLERTTMVLIAPLPEPQGPPPPGLTLDHGQRRAMEEFMERWVPLLVSSEQ